METTFEEKPAYSGMGGYRPGSGRPKGKKNLVSLKKAILEYTSPQELKNMVERAKKMAKTDKIVLMWYLEQVFGKAKAPNTAPQNPTNNIAIFLDQLEKKDTVKIQPDGQATSGKILAAEEPVFDNGQEPKESEIYTE